MKMKREMIAMETRTLDPASVWINSDWYIEWERLARINQLTQSPLGYWMCQVDKDGKVIWEYKLN